MLTSRGVDDVIEAIRFGSWTTAELVRLAHAVATRGINTTSILGQFGEEEVARVFGGSVSSFHQKGYDVRTPNDGVLQVKTYSVGKRPGNIRSFMHDVVTLAVDATTATVVLAKHYRAGDLFEVFRATYDSKYAALGMSWNGDRSDRFERGWTISSRVPHADITHKFG